MKLGGIRNGYLEETAKQSWERMKKCIVTAADETLGRSWKKQPDWFLENADKLKPIIEAKNKARNRMLQSNTEANQKQFRNHQRKVKKTVDATKEEWVCRVATNAETTSRKGRICWESIRKLQGAHAGQRSSKSYAILKDNGELATKPDEIRDRWQQHFERVLNIPSTYQEEVVSKMPQLPMIVGLDDPPTAEELDTALAKLQKRKAAGMTEISPEMILTGPMELKQQLLQLFRRYGPKQQLWMTGKMQQSSLFQRKVI